jgi:hypothetical protein
MVTVQRSLDRLRKAKEEFINHKDSSRKYAYIYRVCNGILTAIILFGAAFTSAEASADSQYLNLIRGLGLVMMAIKSLSEVLRLEQKSIIKMQVHIRSRTAIVQIDRKIEDLEEYKSKEEDATAHRRDAPVVPPELSLRSINNFVEGIYSELNRLSMMSFTDSSDSNNREQGANYRRTLELGTTRSTLDAGRPPQESIPTSPTAAGPSSVQVVS